MAKSPSRDTIVRAYIEHRYDRHFRSKRMPLLNAYIDTPPVPYWNLEAGSPTIDISMGTIVYRLDVDYLGGMQWGIITCEGHVVQPPFIWYGYHSIPEPKPVQQPIYFARWPASH